MFCFFITCNKSAAYLSTLLRHIYRSEDLFLIHCDQKAPAALTETVMRLHGTFKNVDIMLPRPYSWAGFSQLQVTLDAINVALQSSRPWTHLVSLSEQHLPTMSPTEMDYLLRGRGSLVQARPVAGMGPDELADVRNRSASRYEEMEGIGSFDEGAVQINDAFVNALFHGSNWYFLSREHCRFLMNLEQKEFFERFRYTVHADEHAIQTALSSEQARALDSLENIETTFVASPHLTDNNDLVFCAENFWEAKRQKYPFIRKRGPELPPLVQEHLSATHDVDVGRLNQPKQDHRLMWRQIADTEQVASKLQDDVLRRFPKLFCDDTQAIAPRPLFYLTFRMKPPSSLALYVLSENLRDYRALIVDHQPFKGFFDPYQRFGFEFALLRVRVHGLFLNREVARLGSSRGKITLTDANDYASLYNAVTEQVNDMIALDTIID